MIQRAGETRLTRDQVLAQSGFDDNELRQCEEAGLIKCHDGGYGGRELIKLQLVKQVAEHTGGGLQRLVDTYRAGGYSLSWIELCLPEGFELSDMTYQQALSELKLPDEEVRAVLRAAGLADPNPDGIARKDEVDALRAYALVRALPIPLEARLHVVRVTAEAQRRAAEAQSELFSRHVVDPLLESYGDDITTANQTIGELSAAAHPVTTQITTWMFQRAMEYEILKNLTERMEEAVRSGSALLPQRQRDPSVAFIDLAGFTFLSADSGDENAAQLANHFNDDLVDITRAHGGRIVKMLGDGAMLFFDSPESAVRACLELVEQLPKSGLPPARVGINRGPVVAQSGDYYGTTINIAARINDYARPHEVLVADCVIPDGADGIELEEIGAVSLKGVPTPVKLFRARAATPG
jgi:adenylate cyclase